MRWLLATLMKREEEALSVDGSGGEALGGPVNISSGRCQSSAED